MNLNTPRKAVQMPKARIAAGDRDAEAPPCLEADIQVRRGP